MFGLISLQAKRFDVKQNTMRIIIIYGTAQKILVVDAMIDFPERVKKKKPNAKDWIFFSL